ncbi:uncharacterized protein PV07_12773, partial [Cladophialophora immunda]
SLSGRSKPNARHVKPMKTREDLLRLRLATFSQCPRSPTKTDKSAWRLAFLTI